MAHPLGTKAGREALAQRRDAGERETDEARELSIARAARGELHGAHLVEGRELVGHEPR